MPDNTVNSDNNMNLHNYFYGTADHYYHPGWYFDLIVSTVNDLSEQAARAIRPGRFVLVQDSEAVFMRTGDNESYWFVPPIRNNNNEYYYYNDYEHVSGTSTSEETPDPDLGAIETTGFRFIAYTNKMAQIIMENNGSLAIPYSDGRPVLYSATDNLGYMASYYFED